MPYALVRKSDMLLIEVNAKPQSPDPNEFLEIETNFQFVDTHDYRWNQVDSTFYDVGTKPRVASEKNKVITSPFADAEGFYFRGEGFTGTATAGQSTTIDWKLTEERWVNGVHIFLKNHVYTDTFSIHVVDKDYLYAGDMYPAQYDDGTGVLVDWSVAQPNGVLLQPFITNWNVDEQMHGQKPLKSDYPARIKAGLYLRVIYNSTGTVDVDVRMNGLLHKKDLGVI